MNRREFFICLFGGTAARPVATRAQQTGIKISRVGVLSSSFDSPHTGQGFPLLLAELSKLGFSEGQNLALQHGRIDEGAAKAFIAANELVAAKADLLVVSGAETGLQAAAAARPAVPIVVMANNFDPIARGYVASLSHPGGNITGLFYRHPELARKQLELLLEALPGKQRVGILRDHDSTEQFQVAEAAAQILQFKLLPFKLENPP
jgi:putative ABC transport system substrate-binding protein